MKKLTLTLLFALCALPLLAQSASTLFQNAKKEKDTAKQIKLLTQVIDKAPKMADAYHYRGDAYRKQGRYRQALSDYTRMIRLDSKNAFRYYARALAYMDDKKYNQAVADLTQAIALRPAYMDFYLFRAKANMELKKYDAALEDFKKYTQKRRKTPAIALDLANANLHTFKYAEAEKELNWLLLKQPENPEVYYLLGRVYQGRDLKDEAISFYSKAINRNESFANAYRFRASVFKDIGELDASLEDYTKLVELQPDALFFNRRGLVYEETGNYEQALEDYNKAIELNPKWAIPYNNRGYVQVRQKQYAKAKSDFETAIKLDSSMPTPYINLAGTYWLSKKDRKNTYENLETALKRNFKDFDSLYDEDRKGWMFKGINRTAEFRAIMYK